MKREQREKVETILIGTIKRLGEAATTAAEVEALAAVVHALVKLQAV